MNADRDEPGPDNGSGLEGGEADDGEQRRLVDRAELVDRLRMTEQTLSQLYSQLASTGHPDAAGPDGRRMLWDLDEVRAWGGRAA